MYWHRPSFWIHLFVGWLVTALFVGILAACAGLYTSLYRRLDVPLWVIAAAVNVLAVVSGWEYARQHARSPERAREFRVEPRSDDDASAE